MTSKQPTEPGWDANGSPVVTWNSTATSANVVLSRSVDTADFRDEYGELCEWVANERRLAMMLAEPAPRLPEDKL